MPQKRMFSLSIVDTDDFLDMPISAQALYFHLGMHGDDDGFVSSPKRIARAAGCNDDDLRILASKGFIIPFESGVIVIRDWNVNNTLKNDRYHPTIYQKELAELASDKTGRYIEKNMAQLQNGTNMDPDWNQNGTMLEPEHNITEHNIIERGADKPPAPPTSSSKKRFVPPTLEEVTAYCGERHNTVNPSAFIDYYEARGWKYGTGKPMVNWKAAVRTWEQKDKDRKASPADTNPQYERLT